MTIYEIQNAQKTPIWKQRIIECKFRSTVGGKVILPYNYLKTLPYIVHTRNIGYVESAAILPFLAGRIRSAEPMSKFTLGIYLMLNSRKRVEYSIPI